MRAHASRPLPFWHRLNTFFAFPLQPTPLLYAAVLSLSTLLVDELVFLPDIAALLLIEIGIVLAATRYGFKVTALASRGIWRAADFPRRLQDEWVALPWKLFALTVVQSLVTGWLASINPMLGTTALFVLSLSFPATLIVLVQTGSFFAMLNPALAWDTMRIIGWPYALLCLFLFMLSSGSMLAIEQALPLVSPEIVLPLANFVLICFGWIMSSLIGYVMYQHHDAFGIDLLPGGGETGTADTRTPQQLAQQETDAVVAQLVTDGDITAALAAAYEDQRYKADDLVAQRRYHRVLLLSDRTATLLDHARRYIALLLRRDLVSDALKVHHACREKDGSFVLEDASATLALARCAWRGGDARAALQLLSGFDKRFRGDALIPQAYELAARVLVQGLNRADMARPILRTMEVRYPTSEQTQEVRWLLREQSTV